MFPRCQTFDMTPTTLSCHLVAAVYNYPDTDSTDALHVHLYFHIDNCMFCELCYKKYLKMY